MALVLTSIGVLALVAAATIYAGIATGLATLGLLLVVLGLVLGTEPSARQERERV